MTIGNLYLEEYDPNDGYHKAVISNLSNDPSLQEFFFDFESYVENTIITGHLNGINKVYIAKANGEYIGMIIYSSVVGSVELSYAVLPYKRQQGYGYQLLSAFVDYLFSIRPELEEIKLQIPSTNEASIRTALSVGFEQVKESEYKIRKKEYR